MLDDDRAAAIGLASKLLKPLKNNFVERPWGGMRIRELKGLCPLPEQAARAGAGLGEAFEIAAYDDDEEARLHPSRLRFDDGSELALPALLAAHAETLLGADFTQRYGRRFPLLPKTLDVAELLSVQGHPEGNTEVYVIIDADPGATIRLGFKVDVDAAALKAELSAGRRDQQALVEIFGACAGAELLQAHLGPWFARRTSETGALEPALRPMLGDAAHWPRAQALLASLKVLYWRVLDLMNVIEVAPGRVIYNANPARIVARTGRAPSAEVHALGNPEGRELLALEIRRPGPTFRAWDNVRFPVRAVDVDAAIDALNLRRTAPEEFFAAPRPVPGRPGVECSVDCEYFRVEHLRPAPGAAVDVPHEPPHSLHALDGDVTVVARSGAPAGTLSRGESAIVPVGVGAYRVTAGARAAELVKVSVPVPGAAHGRAG